MKRRKAIVMLMVTILMALAIPAQAGASAWYLNGYTCSQAYVRINFRNISMVTVTQLSARIGVSNSIFSPWPTATFGVEDPVDRAPGAVWSYGLGFIRAYSYLPNGAGNSFVKAWSAANQPGPNLDAWYSCYT